MKQCEWLCKFFLSNIVLLNLHLTILHLLHSSCSWVVAGVSTHARILVSGQEFSKHPLVKKGEQERKEGRKEVASSGLHDFSAALVKIALSNRDHHQMFASKLKGKFFWKGTFSNSNLWKKRNPKPKFLQCPQFSRKHTWQRHIKIFQPQFNSNRSQSFPFLSFQGAITKSVADDNLN